MVAKRNRAQLQSALQVMQDRVETSKADYKATKRGRFNQKRKHLPSAGGSADYHIRNEYEYYNLVEDCYDLERNDSIVGQLLDRRSANVIQEGFRLEPCTGDKYLDADLKDDFNAWADDPEQCDISGESTFHDFEYAADWTHIIAGDCGISLTETGHLQFFEPYLIRNDRVGANAGDCFLGVEQDEDRRRLAYWIATDEIDPNLQGRFISHPIETRDDYGRRQFFHVYNRKRMTLTRGVSAFAPIFELTGMLEDVNFAKLVQQQITSCIAFLIEETETQQKNPATDGPNHGSQTSVENKIFDEVEPGMEVNPGAGKKVTGFSPQIPNAEYFQQYRLILQLICGNLDLPLAIGMLDGSETNFHGFIGAINEAKKLWRKSQNRLDRRLHNPLYKAKLWQFMARDRHYRLAHKSLGKKFFDHKWHKPVWQSVKPLDDTQDRLMRLRNAIVSPSKMHAEMNVDYRSHVIETVKDNAFAITKAKRAAAKVNQMFDDGQPVHWSQLYPIPMPDGIQATTDVGSDSTVNALAMQQLGLARERALKAGDQELSDKIANLIDESVTQ